MRKRIHPQTLREMRTALTNAQTTHNIGGVEKKSRIPRPITLSTKPWTDEKPDDEKPEQ